MSNESEKLKDAISTIVDYLHQVGQMTEDTGSKALTINSTKEIVFYMGDNEYTINSNMDIIKTLNSIIVAETLLVK